MATTKVTIRKKASIRGDRQLLYLDFWPPITVNGKQTRREWLHLFTYDRPRDIFDSEHNKKTKDEAILIRSRRENELLRPEIYNQLEIEVLKKNEISEGSFSEFLKKYVLEYRYNDHDRLVSLEKHVVKFAGKDLKFADITEKFGHGFKEYLLKAKNIRNGHPLKRNTANLSFVLFKTVLKRAHKAGYLPINFNTDLGSIGTDETRRNFLTMDELNNLVTAPCNDPVIKRAALFSALTGLRFSDIEKLTWNEVDGQSLNFTQQKTGGVETMPISGQAVELMGSRDQLKPFEGLKYDASTNRIIGRWAAAAGITKKITFHCFRHTYATLQLSAGTDIYTVSKMLGHRDLKTTQVYAKVIDQSKKDAAQRITLKF